MAIHLFQWLVGSAMVVLHPFFISMTEIEYKPKAQTLEISVRIFADDFEKTLREACNCKVDLINVQDKPAMDKLVKTYISKHFFVKINGQPTPADFVGFEQEGESIWTYYEIKKVAKVSKLEVINSLLHDYSEQQVNMLHIKVNGQDKTEKLDYPKNYWVGSF